MNDGRHLLLYIIDNALEGESLEYILQSYFMNAEDAAKKFECGVATINVYVSKGLLYGFTIGNELLIPRDAVLKSSTLKTK